MKELSEISKGILEYGIVVIITISFMGILSIHIPNDKYNEKGKIFLGITVIVVILGFLIKLLLEFRII